MPIPPYDSITNVLPPHLGDPTDRSHISPFFCTSLEVCNRFKGSPNRNEILNGLLDLREQIRSAGLNGFQWISGSYVEDIETQEGRPPNDVDVITFVSSPLSPVDAAAALTAANPNLLSHAYVKTTYKVDHFWISLGSQPVTLIDLTRYWYGLFSHRRDRVWKGMLHMTLQNKAEDDLGRAIIGAGP